MTRAARSPRGPRRRPVGDPGATVAATPRATWTPRPGDRVVPLGANAPEWDFQGVVVSVDVDDGAVLVECYDHVRGRAIDDLFCMDARDVLPAPVYAVGARVRSLSRDRWGEDRWGGGRVVEVSADGSTLDVEWDGGITVPDEDWRDVMPADAEPLARADEQHRPDPGRGKELTMAKRSSRGSDNAAAKKPAGRRAKGKPAAEGYDTAADAAATDDRKPGRTGRASQAALIDTDFPEDKPLIKAATEYVEVRDARMKLTKQEIEARTRVLDLMHQRGTGLYEHGDLRIELCTEEKVKVRLRDDDPEEDDLEDGAPPVGRRAKAGGAA